MSLRDKLDNMMGAMGSKVNELNREVINIRKETGRRHDESQVETNWCTRRSWTRSSIMTQAVRTLE